MFTSVLTKCSANALRTSLSVDQRTELCWTHAETMKEVKTPKKRNVMHCTNVSAESMPEYCTEKCTVLDSYECNGVAEAIKGIDNYKQNLLYIQQQ